MTTFYELRDDVDDMPYRLTYTTWLAAYRAACKKADKLGHTVMIYSVGPHGERYEGSNT